MSSKNKTPNLRLNSWIGSDKPKRSDFNADNEIIDSVVSGHINDTDSHITSQERAKWNTFIGVGVYFGDGLNERTIMFDNSFEISCVIVFANNRPASIVRFTNTKNYNYFAFACHQGGSLGIKLAADGKSMTVKQNVTTQLYDEVASLNEIGVAYTYVMLR